MKRKFYLTIDQELIDLYHECYFETYPRRKVKPIKGVFPPSLNAFIAMKRMVQNSVKQKYKEFAKWMSSFYGIENLNMTNVEMEYTFYFGDNRRRDMDNMIMTPKFINDGLVDSGVMVDDDGKHLYIHIKPFEYDRNHPRLEIVLKEV